MTNEEAYEYVLALEQDRERKWRATEQGAFESAMISRDSYPNTPDVSDGMAGVRRMVREIDHTESVERHNGIGSRKLCISRAAITIKRKAHECLPTFWAVIRNGKNRKESMWELMQESPEKPPVKEAKKGHRSRRRGKRPKSDTGNTLKKC